MKRILAIIMAMTMAFASTACAATTDTKSDKSETTSTVAPATVETSDDKSETEVTNDVIDNELYQRCLKKVVDKPISERYEGVFDMLTEDNKEFFEFAFLTRVKALYNNTFEEKFEIVDLEFRDDFDADAFTVTSYLYTPISTVVCSSTNPATAEEFEELIKIFEENPSRFYEDVKSGKEAAEAK